MEEEEENDKPCSLLKISEEPYGESCQVFVKEDVEEKNGIETSIDVDCREKDPLSRWAFFISTNIISFFLFHNDFYCLLSYYINIFA